NSPLRYSISASPAEIGRRSYRFMAVGAQFVRTCYHDIATSQNSPPCPAKLLVRCIQMRAGDSGKVPRNGARHVRSVGHGVRLAFIDERATPGDRGEP